MDKLQIAHDLAILKLGRELERAYFDDTHICQRYFQIRKEFSELLEAHDEHFFLNLGKK